MATTPFELDTLSAIKRGESKQSAATTAPSEDWSKVEYELPGEVAPATSAVAPAPVVATPAPVVEEEKVYDYQPMNEDGIPIGGMQRIKYRTQDELIQKMQKNHEEAIRQIRKLSMRNRLGDFDQEQIPAEAPRYESETVLQPRDLTPEEKLQISRDMLDPEKVQDAYDRLSEARFGARPEVVTRLVNDTQMNEEALRAKAEGEAFVAETPEYNNIPANAKVIVNWLQKNGLKPVRQNFRLAYKTLDEAGLLLRRPIVREVASASVVPTPQVNTQPEPAATSRITSETQAQPVRPNREISGLSRSNAGDGDPAISIASGTTVKKTLTMAEIDRMPSDEYKRRMKDPKFVDMVNRLIAENEAKLAKRGFPQ